MPPRDDHRTPTETPLSKLAYSTPQKAWTPLDARLARFQQDLDSVPPPPLAQSQRATVEARIQQVHQSGSWELEALLASTTESVKAVAARQMADEIDRRMRAEQQVIDMTSEATRKTAESRKAWAERGWGVLLLLVGALLDRVLR